MSGEASFAFLMFTMAAIGAAALAVYDRQRIATWVHARTRSVLSGGNPECEETLGQLAWRRTRELARRMRKSRIEYRIHERDRQRAAAARREEQIEANRLSLDLWLEINDLEPDNSSIECRHALIATFKFAPHSRDELVRIGMLKTVYYYDARQEPVTIGQVLAEPRQEIVCETYDAVLKMRAQIEESTQRLNKFLPKEVVINRVRPYG